MRRNACCATGTAETADGDGLRDIRRHQIDKRAGARRWRCTTHLAWRVSRSPRRIGLDLVRVGGVRRQRRARRSRCTAAELFDVARASRREALPCEQPRQRSADTLAGADDQRGLVFWMSIVVSFRTSATQSGKVSPPRAASSTGSSRSVGHCGGTCSNMPSDRRVIFLRFESRDGRERHAEFFALPRWLFHSPLSRHEQPPHLLRQDRSASAAAVPRSRTRLPPRPQHAMHPVQHMRPPPPISRARSGRSTFRRSVPTAEIAEGRPCREQ